MLRAFVIFVSFVSLSSAASSTYAGGKGIRLDFSAPTFIGQTKLREDPRYFTCTDEFCTGNFGGSYQTASTVHDGWLAYATTNSLSRWTLVRSSPGPQVTLTVPEGKSIVDFGDLCAPFATHRTYLNTTTRFTSSFYGYAKLLDNGTAIAHREEGTGNQIVFDGLPAPAISFEVHKALTLPDGSRIAIVGANLYPPGWTPRKPPCCNETLFIFHADESSVSKFGMPLHWRCGAKVMDRGALEAIGVHSSEGPNEMAITTLNDIDNEPSLMIVVRTDGGDGQVPCHECARNSHRPFVSALSKDGGHSWSPPRVLVADDGSESIGSARPQLVRLRAGTEEMLLLSGGRPGLYLWASRLIPLKNAIPGDQWWMKNWTKFNVPRLHNQRADAAGLNASLRFCPQFVALCDKPSLAANWTATSGYTGLSRVNDSAALFCYDTCSTSTGHYNPAAAPAECRFAKSSVFCMVIAISNANSAPDMTGAVPPVGSLHASNAVELGTCSVKTKPGAPLSAVQAAARAALNNTSGCSEFHVYLQGTYTISQPVVFTAADSGTETTPVVWRSTEVARATVSGGAVVEGWQRLPGVTGLWSAPLPVGVTKPHQLFVGGHRRIRARSPNLGLFFAIDRVMGSVNESEGIVLANGTLAPVADTRDVEAVVYSSYFAQRYAVGSVDATNRTVRFLNPVSPPPNRPIYAGKHGKQSRVYLENALEFLDTPGEWFANSNHVFYYPHPDEEAELKEGGAVLSVASELLQIQGAAHVRFEGIDFLYTDHYSDVFPLPSGTTDQAGFGLNSSALHVRDSHDIRITNCSVAFSSGYAIWVHGASTDVVVQSCHIYDVGAGGVRFGEGGAGGPAAPAEAWRLVVNNSLIEDGGHVTHAGAGIFVQTNCYACTITHNIVRGFEWSGISVGQVSSFSNSSNPSTYNPAICEQGDVPWPTSYRSLVAYNEVSNIAMGPSRLSDNGGIYSPAINTDIVHNYVHGVGCYTFGGLGIYAEGGGCNLTYAFNAVIDTAGSCYAGHFLNVNVKIENNVFVGRGISSSGGWDNVSLVRNIVDIRQAPLFIGPFEPTTTTRHNIGRVNFSWNQVDSNVYWSHCGNETGCLTRFPQPFHGNDPPKKISMATWKEWRTSGHDAHSILKDPGFVDRDGKSGRVDLRLRDDSPARALGVMSVDVREAGLLTPIG